MEDTITLTRKKKFDFFSFMTAVLFMFYLVLIPAAYHDLAGLVELKLTVLHLSMIPACITLCYIVYQMILHHRKPNPGMIAGGIWIGTLWLSTLFASDKAVAMDGIAGWYMGFTTQLCLAVIFVIFSYVDITDFNWDYFLLPSVVIVWLGVLQRLGVHVLYWEGDRFQTDPMNFSTLGGRTWAEFYVLAVFLIAMVANMYRHSVVTAITIFACAPALLLLNCSSMLIVLGVLYFAFLYLCWREAPLTEAFASFYRLIGGLWWMYAVYRLLTRHAVCGLDKELVIGMVAFYPITWLLYKIGRVKKFKWHGTKNRKWALIVPAIFLGLGITYLVLNTMHRIPAPLSISKLVFDDTFLNRRGCWWKASYLAIKNGTLKEKLFGYGPDCWYVGGYKFYGDALNTAAGTQRVVCAHNEFLNMFVNCGLIGGGVYAGMFVYGLYRAYKQEDIMVAICLTAYVTAQFFNYQTVVSAPLGMVFLGLSYRLIRPVHPIVDWARRGERETQLEKVLARCQTGLSLPAVIIGGIMLTLCYFA